MLLGIIQGGTHGVPGSWKLSREACCAHAVSFAILQMMKTLFICFGCRLAPAQVSDMPHLHPYVSGQSENDFKSLQQEGAGEKETLG